MKLDFWQVTDDPVEKVVTLIAKRAIAQGERVVVVAADGDQRAAISRALWQSAPGDAFLANGEGDAPGADRQPILLSNEPVAVNGASHLILADGAFREAEGFARMFLLFPPDLAPAARAAWRAVDGRDGLERAYYAQEDGRWVKKG